MIDVPLFEPERVRAGDTWLWGRTLEDFPAPDWTLKYIFKHQTNAGFEVVALADSTNHAVVVSSTQSAQYNAGLYSGHGWVEGGNDEKYTVWRGQLQVDIDFRSGVVGDPLDARTDARKIVEQLTAAMKAFPSDQRSVKSYVIGDRQIVFDSSAEILSQLSFWKTEVANEDAADRLAAGLPGKNRLLVRM